MWNKSIESEVIDLLRLPLCIGVVFLHTYTNTQTVAWLNEGKPLYQNICYIFSLGFGEIGVPLFFFISGIFVFSEYGVDFWCLQKKGEKQDAYFIISLYILEFLFYCFVFYSGASAGDFTIFFRGKQAGKRKNDP